MSKSICDSQDSFNVALRSGLKYNSDENLNEAKPWLYVYVVLWVIFLLWAMMLAMQVPAGSERVLHVVFAIVFSPIYVIANLISKK